MLGEIALCEDYGTIVYTVPRHKLWEKPRWSDRHVMHKNQNRVGVKSVFGKTMLGEDPLYTNEDTQILQTNL